MQVLTAAPQQICKPAACKCSPRRIHAHHGVRTSPRCQKICKPAGLTDGDEGERTRFCRCHEAKHHREYQQRNIAEFCTGREHILYACVPVIACDYM